ncbi:MAG: hypothetical protein IT327_06355 [Anaerolineae bacterium]|nr:hypothetical protein [Anaerolineae bacterium]
MANRIETGLMSPVAEEGLLVPANGFGEGPQRLIIWAEERPFAKRSQVAGDVVWGGQLGRELDLVAGGERYQPFIK